MPQSRNYNDLPTCPESLSVSSIISTTFFDLFLFYFSKRGWLATHTAPSLNSIPVFTRSRFVSCHVELIIQKIHNSSDRKGRKAFTKKKSKQNLGYVVIKLVFRLPAVSFASENQNRSERYSRLAFSPLATVSSLADLRAKDGLFTQATGTQ